MTYNPYEDCGDPCSSFDPSDPYNNAALYPTYAVYATGRIQYGQLGLGYSSATPVQSFTIVTGINAWRVASELNADSSFIIKDDFISYGTGQNADGQLGINAVTYPNVFTGSNSTSVSKISCGFTTSILLDSAGYMWGTGKNAYGELGLGNTDQKLVYTQVPSIIWTDISAGDNGSYGIKASDGTVWAVGAGNGRLIDGTTNASTLWVHCLKSDGTNMTGNKVFGHNLGAFVTSAGVLYGGGDNTLGQLGLGTTSVVETKFTSSISGVDKVSAGIYHTVALKDDGTIWGSGNNSSGELGLGATASVNVFTQIGSDEWLDISCGKYHTMAIKNDGSLWATGYNGYGQLGLGDLVNRTTLTQVNSSCSLVSCGQHHSIIGV